MRATRLPPRCWRRSIFQCALLTLTAFWAGPALAACSVHGGTLVPTGAGVPRVPAHGAGKGDPLTTWLPLAAASHVGLCADDYAYPRATFSASGTPWETYRENGKEYSIFATTTPGIGVVVTIDGQPINHDGEKKIWQGTQYFYEYIQLSLSGSVRFIKTIEGSLPVGDTSVPNTGLGTLRLDRDGSSGSIRIASPSLRVFNNPQCAVATRPVSLGIVALAEFDASPASKAQDFSVDLICTGASGAVNYEFTPADAGEVIDVARGVIALDNPTADETAKGIGLQLLETSGTAIQMHKPYVFSTDVRPPGATKQFKARYYKTGPAVTAGRADATVRMLLLYP